MGLKGHQLAEGETIILNLRTHAKALIVPAIVAVVLATAVSVLSYVVRSEDYGFWLSLAAVVVAVAIALRYVALPLWRWSTTRYIVTNRRVSQRSGLLTKVGRDIPLHRVNDIAVTRDVIDRMLGCGTLLISDATEKSGMELVDVPRVDAVQVQIQNLLYHYDDGSDDGEWPPTEPDRPRGRRP